MMRIPLLGCSLFVLLGAVGPAPAQPKVSPTTQFINEYFAAKWKAEKLTPAERTSDEEFLRRVSLDLLGRIATADEVRAFLKDTSADKRAKLVDRLLASNEFAANRAVIWTNWLLPPGSAPQLYRDQLHLWLYESTGKQNYQQFAEGLIAAVGKNNDNGAANFILGNLGVPFPDFKRAEEGQFDMVPATARTLRLFLGYRLVAYQLPDHPVHPDFKTEQFWGVNAFLRQTERVELPLPKEASSAIVLDLKDNPAFNKQGTVSFKDKDGKVQKAAAVFLDGRKLPEGTKSRRQALAALIISHPNFPKAYVNRIWGHFFGRGLHERPAVDDFGSHHKLVHLELLDRLAKDLVASKYEARAIVRAICLSDVYQLRSTTNPTNQKEDAEVHFSRMPLRLMAPDEVIGSVLVMLKGPKARQVAGIAQLHVARRLADMDWDDLAFQEKIIQNVALINLREVNTAILTESTGPVARAMKLDKADKIMEEMYLTALNRRPTEREVTHVQMLMEKEAKGGKDQTAFWQDLYWALINSSEFILNH